MHLSPRVWCYRVFVLMNRVCSSGRSERLRDWVDALIRLKIRVRKLAVLGMTLGLLGCDDGASVAHMRGADESVESPRVQPAEGGTIESGMEAYRLPSRWMLNSSEI